MATNCHAQLLLLAQGAAMVEGFRSLGDATAAVATVTVGAPAAHDMGFKHGGMAEQLPLLEGDPVSARYS